MCVCVKLINEMGNPISNTFLCMAIVWKVNRVNEASKNVLYIFIPYMFPLCPHPTKFTWSNRFLLFTVFFRFYICKKMSLLLSLLRLKKKDIKFGFHVREILWQIKFYTIVIVWSVLRVWSLYREIFIGVKGSVKTDLVWWDGGHQDND